MIILYDTAVRINELLSIKLKDLNVSGKNPYVLVHGKGNKERIVALAEKTVVHLQNYLKVYHQNPRYISSCVVKLKEKRVKRKGDVQKLISVLSILFFILGICRKIGFAAHCLGNGHSSPFPRYSLVWGVTLLFSI